MSGQLTRVGTGRLAYRPACECRRSGDDGDRWYEQLGQVTFGETDARLFLDEMKTLYDRFEIESRDWHLKISWVWDESPWVRL